MTELPSNNRESHKRGTVLVIHVNHFTSKIDGGYWMKDGKKAGGTLRPHEVGQALAERSDARVCFLCV